MRGFCVWSTAPLSMSQAPVPCMESPDSSNPAPDLANGGLANAVREMACRLDRAASRLGTSLPRRRGHSPGDRRSCAAMGIDLRRIAPHDPARRFLSLSDRLSRRRPLCRHRHDSVLPCDPLLREPAASSSLKIISVSAARRRSAIHSRGNSGTSSSPRLPDIPFSARCSKKLGRSATKAVPDDDSVEDITGPRMLTRLACTLPPERGARCACCHRSTGTRRCFTDALVRLRHGSTPGTPARAAGAPQIPVFEGFGTRWAAACRIPLQWPGPRCRRQGHLFLPLTPTLDPNNASSQTRPVRT